MSLPPNTRIKLARRGAGGLTRGRRARSSSVVRSAEHCPQGGRVSCFCSRLLLSLALVVLLLPAAGCGAGTRRSPSRRRMLPRRSRRGSRAPGSKVEWVSFRWKADFFGPSVRQATLSTGGPGSYVQFYRFREAGQAAEAAGRVSRDGNSVPTGDGTASVSWTGPPHFFHQCRMIALFTEGGQDDSAAGSSRDRLVLKALREVMGRQFAGDSSSPE